MLNQITSTVRAAITSDIPKMVEWGSEFHEAGKMPMPYDENKVAGFLESMIAGGGVFISQNGMIGGAIIAPYCSDEWKMAVEFFWWAKGDGMKLLRTFEKWAADNGANEIRMTSLASAPRAKRLLEAQDYAYMELSHIKVLT